MGANTRAALQLTDRELSLVLAVADLDGNQAAADLYGISLRTVKNHLNNAHRKAGVRSTLGLYHRLVRGIRFETTITTRVVREDE